MTASRSTRKQVFLKRFLASAVVVLGFAASAYVQEPSDGPSPTGPSEYLAQSVQADIVVQSREEAALHLTDWAETVGGYFVERSLEGVELRLPAGTMATLREEVQATAETVLTFDPSADDLRNQLVQVEAGIESRRESLDRIVSFLDTADVAATLAFEKELNQILRELENLEGRRRVLRHRVSHVYASIRLSSQDRDIPSTLPSSFEWIDDMGLYRFIEEVKR
jgi:hypothetical protein